MAVIFFIAYMLGITAIIHFLGIGAVGIGAIAAFTIIAIIVSCDYTSLKEENEDLAFQLKLEKEKHDREERIEKANKAEKEI